MSDSLHEQAFDVFVAACELHGEARRRYLDEVCSDDSTLREEVESLLAHDSGEDGLDQAVASSVRKLVDDGALPFDGPTDELPERIDRNRILRVIGEGGMGTVYEAVQEGTERTVALKVVRGGSRGMLRRFSREVRLLGRLRHPGIAQIYDSGTAKLNGHPVPYYAMELIEGKCLTDYAAAQGLGFRARLGLIARICDAVQFAHQLGVIHRDLKPANILVTEEGSGLGVPNRNQSAIGVPFRVQGSVEATPRSLDSALRTQDSALLAQPKILDFGVARVLEPDVVQTLQTDAGQLIGTLAYMSPEQVSARPEEIDTRSDVYALGVIAYELLTGRRPMDVSGQPIHEVVRLIQEQTPDRPGHLDRSLRGDVETIILKAIEKEPRRRYQSAAQMADDIRHFLRDEPIMARAPTAMYQLRMFARRNPFKVVAFAAMIGLVAAFVVMQSLSASRERLLRREATTHAEAASRNANRALLAAADVVMERHPAKARAHLQGVPFDQRGWEWRYLWAKLHWNAAVVEADPDSPTAVAFTNDDEPRAAVSRGGAIACVDVATGQVLRTIDAPGVLQVLALSGDASRLAAWQPEANRVIIVATATGEMEVDYPAPDETAPLAAFNRDGSVVTLYSEREGIRLLNVPDGWQRAQIRPSGRLLRMALSHDGSTLVVLRLLNGTWGIQFYESKSGQPIGGPIVPGGSFAISPDGKTVSISAQQRIALYDIATARETKSIPAGSPVITRVAYSGDQSHLASIDSVGTLRVDQLHDNATQRIVCPLRFPHDGSIALDQAGRRVVVAGEGEVRMWDLQDQNPRILRGHTSYVYNTAFSDDGCWLASGAWDQTVCVWDATTGARRTCLKTPPVTFFFSLAFAPEGSNLRVTLPWANKTMVYDVSADRWIGESTLPPSQMPQRPDLGAALGESRGGAKCARDPEGGEYAATSWDRSKLAEGTDSGDVVIKETTTGHELRRIHVSDGPGLSVAFSPDGARIATGDHVGAIRIWDAASGTLLAELRGHSSQVYSLNFSPDGMRLASGGNDNVIILWDAQRYEQVLELIGHTAYVHSVTFSPDRTQLVSGSGDTTVRIWDTLSPAERRNRLPTAATAPTRSDD